MIWVTIGQGLKSVCSLVQASCHDLFLTPTYLVNKLYSDNLGTTRLASAVQSSVFSTSLQGKDIPMVDAIATRSTDGTEIFIVVNKDSQNDLPSHIDIQGVDVAPRAEFDTITSASSDSSNSFATPTAIALQSAHVPSRNRFDIRLPRSSVSVLTLHVAHQE
jgi:alpha-L-arabinofuranosidase